MIYLAGYTGRNVRVTPLATLDAARMAAEGTR